MASVAEIDERLALEEAAPLTEEEKKYAEAALAGLAPEQRERLSELDIITCVRWVTIDISFLYHLPPPIFFFFFFLEEERAHPSEFFFVTIIRICSLHLLILQIITISPQ